MDYDINSITTMIGTFITEFGLKLLGAIIVLIAGFWLVGRFSKMFKVFMSKRNLDPSLRGFLSSLVSMLLKILVVITVMSVMGIPMTSFIAILGAAGLAVGLALSGTLQNFAGGVLLLILKPFKVGDFIEAQGFMGTVKEIQIFNTLLNTPDNRRVIIPNGGLATGAATNFSTNSTRRVQWVFGIAYGEKFAHAKGVIMSLIEQDDRILKDPEPFIALSELADSSVNITVRAWVNTPDFWDVFFDMNEKVYAAFEQADINIPFPQMDVHLKKV